MDKLSKLLDQAMSGKTVLARQVKAGLVVEFVNNKIKELWGKKGQDQAKALSLKNQTLTINCATPIMAQELKFKDYTLRELINEKFGERSVKKLKIVQKGVEKLVEEW